MINITQLRKMTSIKEKKQTYVDFFQDEDLEILLVVDVSDGCEFLTSIRKDKDVKHGEVIVYSNDGTPEIWAAKPKSDDYPCKTVFMLHPDDKALIAALQQKYGSMVKCVEFS